MVQVDLALARVKTINRLAVMADSRAEMRDFCKDSLNLDPAVNAACRVDIAAVIEAWEAAKVRTDVKNNAEAEAAVNSNVKVVPKQEIADIRNRFEQVYEVLDDNLAPSNTSLESLFEQIDQGEFKFMQLKEFASREDVEQESWGTVLMQSSGQIKIKKNGIDTGMPRNPEELRRKLKLVGHHFMFAKIRYPTKAVLSDMHPTTFVKLADFLLGDRVMGLEAKDEHNRSVAKPQWQLILSYQFQILKKALGKANQGEYLASALVTAMTDVNLRERYFTTPLSIGAVADALGGSSARDRSRSPRRSGKSFNGSYNNSYSQGNYNNGNSGNFSRKGKGKGKFSKGKGKGKFGKSSFQQLHSTTPDGRRICYAYNSQWERCRGKCEMIHVCRICLKAHPMHMHNNGDKSGSDNNKPAADGGKV